MKIGDAVRVYDGEWFNEGQIVALDGDMVDVDFADWVQRYRQADLREVCEHMQLFWMPLTEGERIQNF